jgi:hypothetical protein
MIDHTGISVQASLALPLFTMRPSAPSGGEEVKQHTAFAAKTFSRIHYPPRRGLLQHRRHQYP